MNGLCLISVQHDFWAEIQTNNPSYDPPEDVDGSFSNSLNRLAQLKQGQPPAKDLVKAILEKMGLQGNDISELEQRTFHKHLKGYANLWSSDCPIQISTTNRYTVNVFEGAVAAKRTIRKGDLLYHLCGTLGEIKGATRPSAVRSTITRTTESKRLKEYLLLGPARFVNHDCVPNAEFFVVDNHEVIVRAKRGIEKGEEVTVHYGENYFAPDFADCLCGSCEIRSLGAWASKAAATNRPGNQRAGVLRRDAPRAPKSK